MEQGKPFWPSSTRAFVSFCAVVPIIFLLSPSYIHPDELFQSQEVLLAAGVALGKYRYANIPWEFADARNPSRSIAPPAIFVGLPLRLWSRLTGGLQLEVEPLIARTGVVLLTALFAFPTAAWIAKNHGLSPRTVLALLASSWVGVVMTGRPFSNSSESLMLFALLATYLWFRKNVLFAPGSSAMRSAIFGLLIGALGAFGVFVRFTFAAFALPLACMAAVECFYAAFVSVERKKPFGPLALVVFTSAVAVGAVSTMALVIAIDSVFFGGCATLMKAFAAIATVVSPFPGVSKATRLAALSSLRIAPWNNFLYNLDTANLALHGLHPRWLHLAVNGHIMYGPLWLPALVVAVGIVIVLPLRRAFAKIVKAAAPAGEKADNVGGSSSFLLIWSASTLLFSLFVVSTAPHQEARFLAPLLWPVAFLGAYFINVLLPATSAAVGTTKVPAVVKQPPLKAIFWSLWLAFNAILALLFGVLHQAHLPTTAAALGQAFRATSDMDPAAVSAASFPPADSELYTSISNYLRSGTASRNESVTASFISLYMVPHTATGLLSPLLLDGHEGQSTSKSSSFFVQQAPWVRLGKNSPAQRVREAGGVAGVGEQEEGGRRLYFREHTSFDSLQQAVKRDDLSHHRHLIVYPSTISHRATQFLAAYQQQKQGPSCRLLELHRRPHFISTEDAPDSLEGWMSALFLFPPFDKAFEALTGRKADIPSLVISAWDCQNGKH
jgi:GPI mannosyltransferase 4